MIWVGIYVVIGVALALSRALRKKAHNYSVPMFLLVAALWPAFMPMLRRQFFDDATPLSEPNAGANIKEMQIPVEWLLTPTSEETISNMDAAAKHSHAYYNYERIRKMMTDGDQLYDFSSPANTWEKLCGRQGIALVRDGKPIAAAITLMN